MRVMNLNKCTSLKWFENVRNDENALFCFAVWSHHWWDFFRMKIIGLCYPPWIAVQSENPKRFNWVVTRRLITELKCPSKFLKMAVFHRECVCWWMQIRDALCIANGEFPEHSWICNQFPQWKYYQAFMFMCNSQLPNTICIILDGELSWHWPKLYIQYVFA